MKIAISFFYEWVLHDDFKAGKLSIDGSGGVYGKVGAAMMLTKTHYATIKAVVDETIVCIEKGTIYQPFRKTLTREHQVKVKPTSLDMHQIAKLKVNGSFRITADLFNACIRGPAGLPPIGYTSIYNAIKKSNHAVVKTQKRPQSSNSNLIWVQARFQAASQMIVRFGLEYPEDTAGAKVSDLKYINRDLLEAGGHTFGIHQVAWWDEKHVEQVVGELRDHTLQFGLDEDGIYSPDIIFQITEKVS